MTIGLSFLKFIPMDIWGANILFDASMHITATCLALYIAWFFIDQDKTWRIPFFIFSALVLSVVAIQRINANAHNDIGLGLGLAISLTSIFIAERKKLKKKISF